MRRIVLYFLVTVMTVVRLWSVSCDDMPVDPHLSGSTDSSTNSSEENDGVYRLVPTPPLPVHWTYLQKTEDSELTASDWSKKFPKCSGRRQSPLWVDTNTAYHDPALRSLTLIDYDDSPAGDLWSVVNNGHAVQFNGFFRTPPQMQGANLPGKYIFQQMHFHWGSNNSIGSEHKVNGKSFPLEVHLVHRRKNDTDEEAQNDGDGMAVIGVMFEVTKSREQPNRHMEDIISAVRKVTVPGRPVNATLPNFSLSELLPTDPSFFRYMGSLTTPPCSEAVVWTVMTSPLKITETQLSVFRSLMKALAEKAFAPTARALSRDDVSLSDAPPVRRDLRLMDNFRPLQPAYERNVSYYDGSLSQTGIRIISLTSDPIVGSSKGLPRMAMMPVADPGNSTTAPTVKYATGINGATSRTSSKFIMLVLAVVWLKSV